LLILPYSLDFGHSHRAFRVLFVTTTPERLSHLIETIRGLERGHGLFLFTDFESLRHSPYILTHP